MKQMNPFAGRKRTEDWVREQFHRRSEELTGKRDESQRKIITEQLAVLSYRKAIKRKRSLSFAGLVCRQIRYTGIMVWMWQTGIFLGIMLIYHTYFRSMAGTEDIVYYRWFRIYLCTAGVISAWSSVPFLFRSFRWKMAETESAARCPMFRLRTAQLLLIGGGAVLMMAGVGTAAWFQKKAGAGELAVYLVLPFFCLGCCILHLIRKGRMEHLFRNCSVLGAGILFVFTGWNRLAPVTENQPQAGRAWLLCGIMAFILFYQIWIWKKEEEKRWSLV